MAIRLTLMIVSAVAGREAARELSVFQIMELRSTIGLLLLWPLVRAAGGGAALKTRRLRGRRPWCLRCACADADAGRAHAAAPGRA